MTLSQTAVLIKQIINTSIFVSILGLISFFGYKAWHAYYLAHLPIVEEKPDTKFGLLPQLSFPKVSVTSTNFTYSIETPTGNLPQVGKEAGFEKFVKVYFVTKTFASLLSSEKSQNLAEKFGITTPPEILSETSYKFRDKDKLLNVDLDSGNFMYLNEATKSAENLDEDNKLVSDFKQSLQNLGVYKEELGRGRSKVILLKNDGGKLVPTTQRAEAQTAQISLWPAPLEGKPIITPEFNKSLISAVVIKSADNLENYLSLNFSFFPVDTTTFATYPIKSTDAALEDLKGGKGVIVIEPDKPKVSITSVYLGYFLPENYSPYLQPIFIFEGANFVAYVRAINEQFQSGAN